MAEIKIYSKTELALLYFPNSSPETARRHLMNWINGNENLKEALVRKGYQPRDRIFKKSLVQLIFDYLDEP